MAGLIIGSVSCTKYLDMTPTDKVADKVMWESTANAEYHVNYIYSYIYDVLMGQSVAGETEAFTDMLKYGSYNYNSRCYIPSELAYGAATTLTAGYVHAYLGTWASWYQGIAKTNNAINCLHKFGKMEAEDMARLEGELRFMRAFLYFDLVKRYKEVILYDEDMTAYAKDKALSTEEEGWDMIQADLEYAAANLPDRTASKGRLNKGMAWGFMTRTMLYAKRYDLVIAAAEEVEALGYGLEALYKDSYTKSVAEGNNEAILQYLFDRTNNVTNPYDFYYTPGGDFSIHLQAGGGYGTPTQEMVESYELAEGGFPDWTPWHGTTTQTPPYEKLEPRFHASILYNGAKWKNRSIEPYVGGADGWCTWNLDREPKGRTTTGYYLRKMVDESHDVIAYTNGVQPMSVIRYAEVLLNKAEACYNTEDIAGANAAVKAIRDRVNLPYRDKGGKELWNAIRQERKVELAYEGLWYWDLRRWGVAHKAYPEGLTGYQQHGLKIEKNDDGTFKYTYVSVDDQDRNFPEKMYRFPMPSSELDNNGLVEQYPEWK